MIELDGDSLTLEQLIAIAEQRERVALRAAARARVQAARAIVDEFAHHDTPTYGINTGFGNFAEVKIPRDQLDTLQVNLLRSHAAGVGEPLPPVVVRATMALRANVLAKGFSGIRLETLQLLIELLNRGVHPTVPSRGSVGASGDLAPLAHLALVLIGEGEVEGRAGVEALHASGLEPITLAPKEGLALINGTQPSTAQLGLAVHGAERLARAADIAAAMTIDGLQGSTKPFDRRIHEARRFAGQAISAENVRELLGGSGINVAHANCGRVRMRIPCAARRRCTVPRARHSPSRAAYSISKPTRRPTIPWCSPRHARSFPEATSMARPWPLPATSSVSDWRNWRPSASEEANDW
jgi:histidine ammonia-lyase